MIRQALAAGLLATTIGASAALAQPSAVHKTTLQTLAFPGPTYNTTTVRALIDKGGTVARHTHPGVEMAYVISGEALVKIEGRPDQRLKDGDSFAVPPKTPHSVHNIGPGTLTLISTYVVDKTQPIATPAP